MGGYADGTGMGMPVLTTAMSAGCYVIPNVSIAWRNVLTTQLQSLPTGEPDAPRPRTS